MDNFVYNRVGDYFSALSKLGYISNKKVNSLLALIFYYRLMYQDYRGYVSKDDYHLIEQALNCLYGTNCLIPYPNYQKMGKLKIGEMSEMANRIKATEEYSKELDQRILDNDVLISDNIRRIDEHGTRLDEIYVKNISNPAVAAGTGILADHERHLIQHDEHLAQLDTTIEGHDARIVAIERTKVVKGKNHIKDIPDIDLSSYTL